MPGILVEDLLAKGFAVEVEEVYDFANLDIYVASKTPSRDTGAREVLASISGLHFSKGVGFVASVHFSNCVVGVLMKKGQSFSVKCRGGGEVVVSEYSRQADGNGDICYKAEHHDFMAPLGFLLERIGFDFSAYENIEAEAVGRSG